MFSEELVKRIMGGTKTALMKQRAELFPDETAVKEAVVTLYQLMKIKGTGIDFEDGYYDEFIKDYFDKEPDNMGIFHVEGLMKKILYIVDQATYDAGPDGNPDAYWELGKLYWHFHILQRYPYAVKQQIKNASPDGKFHLSEQEPKRFFDCGKLCEDYCRAYHARNDRAHNQLVEDDIELLNMRYSVLRVYLDMCKEYEPQIRARYALMKAESIFEREEYAKKVVEDYSNRENKYVSVHWNEVGGSEGNSKVTILELLEKNKSTHVIKLIGCAGVGKTESIKYLQYMQCKKYVENPTKEELPLAIYLPLIEMKGDMTVKKMLAELLQLEKTEHVHSILTTYACELYLDGYNEILKPEKRAAAKEEIEELIEKYPAVRFIIADRSVNTNPRIATKASVYQLDNMDKALIDSFFEKNCLTKEGKQDTKTLEKIKEIYNKDLKWLEEDGTTPFMLLGIIEMIQANAECPQKSATFFQQYIENKLAREEDNKGDYRLRVLRECLIELSGELMDEEDSDTDSNIRRFFADISRYDIEKADGLFDLAFGLDILEAKEEAGQFGWSRNEYAQYFYNLKTKNDTGKLKRRDR